MSTAALYDRGRQAFGDAEINWTSDDIRIVLVDTDTYTVNLATHDHLDDIPEAARVATMAASLAGKSNSGGVLDATDPTLTVTGHVGAVVFYKYNADPASALLLAYNDDMSEFTLAGSQVTIQFSSGANKIMKL